MKDFADLIAVVTGGASGIGAATAHELAARGARVAVIDRTESSAGDLNVAADLADDRSIRDAVAQIARELGGIDILINNAGVAAFGQVEGNDDVEWHRVYDINVVGLVRATRASLPFLRRSSSAAIVNTASIAGIAGLPERALYSATKGAVIALTKAMAADHVKDGIRVSAVAPGTADTPWVQRQVDAARDPEEVAASLRARQPIGRLVSADEVAFAIAYLASPRSASTTGTILTVDGGLTSVRL